MKNILIAILSLVVIFLFFKGCNDNQLSKKLSSEVDNLTLEKNKFKSDFEELVDENGELIARASSIYFENDELQKQLKDERLKKLKAKIQIQTETRYDTILMNIHDTIVIENGVKVIKKTFEHKTNWITIKGEVHDTILNLKELEIHDSLEVQLGQEKAGWFKKKNVVLVKSKNPNTDFKGVRSYEFGEKKKWYERGGWKFASGIILTLIIISQI